MCTDAAAAMLAAGLETAASHGAGWMLPIEPLLAVMRSPETWRAALERVQASAT